MRKILLLVLLSVSAFGQEVPYYEPLSTRKLKDAKFLPNLSTTQNRIYIAAHGGVSSYSSTITPEEGFLSGQRNIYLNYAFSLGFVLEEKNYWEAAYARNEIGLRFLADLPFNGFGDLNYQRNLEVGYFMLRFKRSIWVIDKVTRNARLLVHAGLGWSPELSRQSFMESRRFRFPLNVANSIPDTAFVSVNYTSAQRPFLFETGLEIHGNLSEQVSLGLFSHIQFRSSQTFTNEIFYGINTAVQKEFQQT